MESKFIFSDEDINKITAALNGTHKRYKNHFRIEIKNVELNTSLYLEIYSNIDIGKEKGNLISVYAPLAHLQLHFCTGYIISDVLEEVTFISENNNRLSGLTIEKIGGCSLYSNVNRSLLSGDFTQLGPEVMLSSIALSLAEEILLNEDRKN